MEVPGFVRKYFFIFFFDTTDSYSISNLGGMGGVPRRKVGGVLGV